MQWWRVVGQKDERGFIRRRILSLSHNYNNCCMFWWRWCASLPDIPVFPTITATVTFQEFRYDEFDDSIFTIPNDYKEDPSRFPDLWAASPRLHLLRSRLSPDHCRWTRVILDVIRTQRDGAECEAALHDEAPDWAPEARLSVRSSGRCGTLETRRFTSPQQPAL